MRGPDNLARRHRQRKKALNLKVRDALESRIKEVKDGKERATLTIRSIRL